MTPPLSNFFTFGDGVLLGSAASALGIFVFVALVRYARSKGWF